MNKFFLILISLVFSTSVFSQEKDWIGYMEFSINGLFEELFLSDGTKFIQSDKTKLELSFRISEELKELLVNKESFNYPYDSLKRIGIIKSQDGKVKIYTWSIKLDDGSHKYYGFIQRKDGKSIKVYQLIADSENMPHEEIAYIELDHKHWYGVNYYQIIDFKYRGKKMYALLGARNNKLVSKTKLIEILSFVGKRAKLGKRVFTFNRADDLDRLKRKQYRIVEEYSHHMSMTMTYDKRYKMIVFDQLAPEISKLKDIRRFYGPDGSYDAFSFNGYKWLYIPDKWATNVRNKKTEVNEDDKNKVRSKKLNH